MDSPMKERVQDECPGIVQVDLFCHLRDEFFPLRKNAGYPYNPPPTKKGATARNADRSVPKDQSRSAAWDVAPVREAAMCSPPQPRVSPGAEREARLPVRHKLYCEAPTGVADPITTWSSEVGASTLEGG